MKSMTAVDCLALGACTAESADQVDESMSLYGEVRNIIQRSCSSSRCHGGIIPGGRLVFDRNQDFRTVLVDVPACEYDFMLRVRPHAPEASWLIIKLTSEVYDTPERAGWIRFQPDPLFDSPTNDCGFVADDGYDTFLRILPQGNCGKGIPDCYSVNEYARRMFLESDTTISVLSGIPAIDGQNPLTNEEIAQSRDIINRFAESSQRVVNHCMVLPNYNTDAQFAGMQDIKERFGVAAWKCYTPWGPGAGNTGWMFTDEVGLRFIERGRQLGVRLFCAHKGLPLPGFDNTYGDPKDIGVVAKQFPDVGFIVYHSAYEFNGGDETQPFARTGPTAYQGVNSLVNALLDNGIAPNANVYGELGTTWYNVRNDPTAASHVLGKLLKYVGEDNVVWGTDCMWYGSPQPIIESFVAFQISDQFQQQYGYPALTPAIKAKVLGLNAARAYGVDPKATRCAVNASELAVLKRNLDAEFGSRRWALQKPVLRTRRDFLRHVAEHRAKGTPG